MRNRSFIVNFLSMPPLRGFHFTKVYIMLYRRLSPFSRCFKQCLKRNVHYVQGQSPTSKTREYFYFIDHQGQLFLDDSKMKNFTSCFKEKKFLDFFFSRLRINETGCYMEDFPYLSPCGRERNFIRCDDKPIVYVHLSDIEDGNQPDLLSYGYAGSKSLSVNFEPEKICMLPESGRIYHPADPEIGGIGLIKSNIAIAISKYFDFENGEEEPPTHFTWKGKRHTLTNEIIAHLVTEQTENPESKTDGNV